MRAGFRYIWNCLLWKWKGSDVAIKRIKSSCYSEWSQFPWVINGLIEAFISLQRLGRFLSCTELNSNWGNFGAIQVKRGEICPSGNHNEKKIEDVQEMSIIIQNAEFVWFSSQQEYQNLVLKQISVETPKGLLTVVLGEVGAGKSSLLSAILGEMRLIEGEISQHDSVAYIPLASWIQSGTVCDNILFGKEYDRDRYTEVLAACALLFEGKKCNDSEKPEVKIRPLWKRLLRKGIQNFSPPINYVQIYPKSWLLWKRSWLPCNLKMMPMRML